jgi:hypothetical protein
MTKGIEIMVLDTALREQFSINAKIESAKYSWKKTASSTIEIFEEAFEIRKHRNKKNN